MRRKCVTVQHVNVTRALIYPITDLNDRARKAMHFAFGSRAAEPMDRKQTDRNSLWNHSKQH